MFATIQSVFNSAPVGLCALDLDFRYVVVNDCFATLYNKRPEQFVGRNVSEVLPEQANQILENLRSALREGGPVESEIELIYPGSTSDERVTYLRTSEPMRDSTGRIIGLSEALLDITARKQAETALRESEANLRHTVELTPHIPWTAGAGGELTFMSPRWTEVTGMRADREALKRWIQGIHVEDRERTLSAWKTATEHLFRFDCDCRIHCLGGAWRWHRTRAYPLLAEDGRVLKWYGTIEDIHNRKLDEVELAANTRRLEEMTHALDKLARQDHLTGLANRRTFDETLLKEVARASRSRMPLALMLLDVDHFKRWNDDFGHQAGDEVLRLIAVSLTDLVRRSSDLAARFGGEEFALVMANTSAEGALLLAERAHEAVRQIDASQIAEGAPGIRISAGVAMLELNISKPVAELAANLLAQADSALYQAKQAGRDRVLMHAPL